MLQLAVNGIVAGAAIALVAIGFALCYRVAGFFHFTHGALFTAGPYLALLLLMIMPLPAACLLAVVMTGILGAAIEGSIYRPLRKKGGSSLVLLIASLGGYTVLANAVSLAFGDETRTLRAGTIAEGMPVFGARITHTQIMIVCVSVALILAAALLLNRTRAGRAMQAVANDPRLAEVVGLDSDRVILLTFAVGSALAGAAGVLLSFEIDMTPTMGMGALLVAVVAAIVGGIGSIPGLALGSLLVGLAQNFGVWEIGSEWQEAIVFVILLGVLVVRPQGFMGRASKKASV